MANGLPYAIAAQVAYPDRQVVAFVGDGGFSMLMGEFATAVQVPAADQGRGHQEQRARADQVGAAGVARQPGVSAATCSRSTSPTVAARLRRRRAQRRRSGRDRRACCDEALASPGPAVVEAVVDPNEPPMPGHITTTQALHFAEALARGDENRFAIIKSVIGDKVREVI